MGRDHRIALLALAFVVATGVALGCRGKPRGGEQSVAPAASTPPDRLAPGEPAPGQEKAFELLLPRGARIDRSFGGSVYVHVPHPPEKVANWVREQSDDAEAVVGPTGTVFSKMHVRGADTSHHLRVEISPGVTNDMTSMVVDRVEDRPKDVPSGSNEELMKKAGLTPEGKLLDPTRVE